MDKKAIEYHVQGLIKAIGEDPDREGLRETPKRVAEMLAEVLEGTAYTNHDIAEMFGKTFADESGDGIDNAVVMKDITRLHPPRKGSRAEQNRAHMRYGGKKASAPGKTRQGHRRNHQRGCGHTRRRRCNQRLSQLYDGSRNTKRVRENRNDDLYG